MRALVFMMVADFIVSAVTCCLVYRHHRMEFSGPHSATSRILLALTDMRVRLELVERMIPHKEV